MTINTIYHSKIEQKYNDRIIMKRFNTRKHNCIVFYFFKTYTYADKYCMYMV